MSERRRIEARLETLADIREIMGALRNTAVIETTRLRRLADAQQALIDTIERAAADFLSCHPPMFQIRSAPVYVFFGSERGFCGDYNHALLPMIEKARAEDGARIIVVGSRLGSILRRRFQPDTLIDGATVSDDIPIVVERLAVALGALQVHDAALPLSIRFVHQVSEGRATRIEVRQPFEALAQAHPAPRTALLIQLAPLQLARGLIEQYLYAALHVACHAALLAENLRRQQHVDAAVRRIDARSGEIARRRDRLRQEEITEEIELILLSADVPATRMSAANER